MIDKGAWPARVALITLFFSWGLMSVMVDMTIPYFKTAFELGYRDAMLVQSSFFLAYLLLARRAGTIAARLGFGLAATVGLTLMAGGALLLSATTLIGEFYALLPSVFIIASGIALLQVSANPLAAIVGGTASAAGNLTLVQGFNSVGTVAAPLIASYVLLSSTETVDRSLSEVRHLFIGFAVFLILLSVACRRAFAARSEATAHALGGRLPFDDFAKRRLIVGSLAIFAYVGAEVSIASTLVNFLESDGVLDASREHSARYVAFYWGGALAGRFLAVPILTRLPQEKVLGFVTVTAAALAIGAMTTNGSLAAVLILSIGLFNAIQFPVIFSIASSDLLPEPRAKAAGWLCTGIVGGAVIPLLFGQIADSFALENALIVPALCYIYIAVFAVRFGKERPASPARSK